MTRWDYDTVFYRVFCSALLAVALTFTVILTNVFIDIDGLLSKKNIANTEKLETVQADVEDVISTNVMPHDAFDYKDYAESYGERTKRSLETQNYGYRIKDPNVKRIITNRLAALLDDMDREELSKNNQEVKPTTERNKKIEKYIEFKDNSDAKKNYKAEFELVDIKKITNKELDAERIKMAKEQFNDEDMKHLAMHNIILQGIVGHMDLGEVYGRVHALFHNNLEGNKVNLKDVLHPAHEKLFFNELTNCKQLQKEIAGTVKPEVTTEVENIKTTVKPPGRNVMIKTIIDITSLVNDKTNQDDASSKENVNGIIKLIYNGKSLKFRRVDESTTTIKPKLTTQTEKLSTVRMDIENVKDVEDKILDFDKKESTYVPNAFMNKMISDYFKRLSKATLDNDKKITTKRLKRHIKIRYENEHASSTTETSKDTKKKGDDELYVEIETHFDSKGMKGEKKKKIIRDLIEKIQKAIHSDNEVKKKKHKHLHVKKRTQNPLDDNTASLVKKMLMPLNNLEHRNLAPISKSVPLHEELPRVSDDNGDDWREKYYGPRFLTASKAINSAEMSEVDTDYNKMMDNGIPQRLQKPLNTDTSDSIVDFNRNDPGNSQFVVKDIAGSGFSIGFNQYVDEPPDAESMKLFSGIENILHTYHQKYDEGGVSADNTDNPLKQEIYEEPVHYEYPSKDDHTIVRRSIKKLKQDYHSNEYKVIFNKNFLKYNNYQDIYNHKRRYSKKHNTAKDNTVTNNVLLKLNDNIFNKVLKPAEIFNLADILERQKRSLNVKKISNIKSKKKLNRYINTKSMASRKIFQQKKRNKRQIGKIRIIAKDISENHKRPSSEDVFVFSNEKIFADRAMMKEVDTPEMEPKETMKEEHFDLITPQQISEDHFDAISPQHIPEDHFDIISPYIFEEHLSEISGPNSIFTRKSRHNSLMSKYPHIFMEEISKSKEDFSDNQIMYAKVANTGEKHKAEPTTQVAPTMVEMPQPQDIPETKFKYSDLQDNMDYPPQPKGNYKVTVKIMPKNKTGLSSGFKEIHTSINKSFNKNGLMYTSLVNVSEISKVEKINKTKDNLVYTNPSVKKLKREQMRMKHIIQQHKDRIEEQLAHLNREKEKLDRIDVRNADILRDASKDFIDFIPNTPENMMHYKEDTGHLLKIEETTTEQHTTTTEHIQVITENPEKLKIIETIERNENITNEILQKIDKNTNILQTFLDKLLSKIETKATTQKPESKKPEKEDNNLNSGKPNEMNEYNLSQLLLNMPRKNISGLPFVYAFQHPYKTTNGDNKNAPIASIVYQGHILAQTFKPEVNRRNMWAEKEKARNVKPTNNVAVNTSSTKFFIDDLEEYKVLPVVGKTVFTNNTTKI